jgi:DNA invertase Pin-like site-specific DNA recombinase
MGSRRVLGAIRLSRDTDESTSAERQRQIITAWASAHEATIVGWSEDLGVSGSIDPWHRPQLGSWLRGDHGPFDTIVVWRLDRLARRVLHFATLLDWAHTSHTDLASATEGFDLTTPLGRMLAQMIAMLAEGELEAIKERTKSSYDHLVSVGRHRGGFLPYGYCAEPAPTGGYRLVVDPDCAKIVTTIVERIMRGDTISSVVAWLNASKIPTSLDTQRLRAGKPTRGAHWQVGNLSRLLRSRTLLGYLHPDNGQPIIGPDGCEVRRAEPILTDRQWQQLQHELDTRRTRRKPTNRRGASMLLRVAFCGACGRPMYTNHGRSGPYYRCSSRAIGGVACGNGSISARRLEALVTDAFLNRVGSLPVHRKVFVPGTDHTREIDTLRTALERLIDRLEKLPAGGDAENAVLARIHQHEQRLTQLRKQPSSPDTWRYEPTDTTFHQLWDTLDTPGRGRLLRDCNIRVHWTRLTSHINLGDLEQLSRHACETAATLATVAS